MPAPPILKSLKIVSMQKKSTFNSLNIFIKNMFVTNFFSVRFLLCIKSRNPASRKNIHRTRVVLFLLQYIWMGNTGEMCNFILINII